MIGYLTLFTGAFTFGVSVGLYLGMKFWDQFNK
jgi:hypothetical protein